MSSIEKVHARQILDSRGNPTVEVDVLLKSGSRGPRRRALGRLDGRVRGRGAPRWRRRLGGQGRDQGGGQRERRAGRGGERPRPRRPGRARPHHDRAGRHAQQGPARRQRDPGRVAGCGKGRRGRGRLAALALPRRRGGARAAGADDERAERRCARRQQGRLPGVHDHAGGGAELLGGAPHRSGGLPRPQAHPPRPRALHGGGRRGRLRARPRLERGGARDADRGDRGGGPPPGRRRGHRARPGHQRDLRQRLLRARARGPHALLRGDGRLLGRHGVPLPDRVDRGRDGRGGLGRLEAAHRDGSATRCSSSATTSS